MSKADRVLDNIQLSFTTVEALQRDCEQYDTKFPDKFNLFNRLHIAKTNLEEELRLCEIQIRRLHDLIGALQADIARINESYTELP